MASDVLGNAVFSVGTKIDMSGLGHFASAVSDSMGKIGGSAKMLVDLNKNLVKVQMSSGQASNGMDAAGASAESFSHNLYHTSFALAAVSAGMTLMLKNLGSVAYGYDRSMTMVKAVTGATSMEMERMGEMARSVGEQTEYGATKAAEALLILARMGLSSSESMQVLTPAMKLAQSQQEDLAQTTELVVQQLKVFGKSMSEAGTFSNVLAATSSRTAADLDKLNLALAYAGPIAAQTGKSFEEVNATLGLMFNAGIRASTAGTSLRFALASLLGTTVKTKSALKQIGLSMSDVDPSVKSMNEILMTLADRLRGVENRAAIVFDIFGKRAASAMGAVIENVIRNRDAFASLERQITGTQEAEKQYEVQMNSFSGIILKIRSSIQELVLSFSDELLPSIRLISETFLGFVKFLQGLPEWVKQAVGMFAIMGTALASVGAAFTGFIYTTGLVSRGLKNLGVSAAGLVPKFTFLWKSAKEYSNIMKTADAVLASYNEKTLRSELRMNSFSAKQAKAIATEVRHKMAIEKTSAAKIRAAQATLAYQVSLYSASEAEAATTLNALTANKAFAGFTAALAKTGATAGVVGTALKGLFAALGGWIGITIIAITALVAIFTKWRAGIEETKRKNKEMLETVSSLSDELVAKNEALIKTQKDLAKARKEGDTKKINDLTAEEITIKDDLNSINLKLIQTNPELLKSYSFERNEIQLNIDKINEYIRLKKEQDALESVDKGKSKSFLEKVFSDVNAAPLEIKEGETGLTKLQVLRNAQDELLKQQSELQVKLKMSGVEVENLGDKMMEAAQSGMNAEESLQSLGIMGLFVEGKMKGLRKELENNAKAQTVIVGMAMDVEKEMRGVSKVVTALDEDLDEGAGKVDKFAASLESLANQIENATRSLKDMREQQDMELEGLSGGNLDSEYLKKFMDIRQKEEKELDKIDKTVKKVQDAYDTLSTRLGAKGASKLGPMKQALEELYQESYKTVDSLEELSDVIKEQFVDKGVKEAVEESIDLNEQIEQLTTDTGSLENAVASITGKWAKEDQAIEKTIRNMMGLREVIKRGMAEGFASEDDLNAIDKLIEKLKKLRAAKEDAADLDTKKAEVADFVRTENEKMRVLEATNAFDLQKQKARLDTATKIYEKKKNLIGSEKIEVEQAYNDMTIVAQDYERAVVAAAQTMSDAIFDIADALAANNEAMKQGVEASRSLAKIGFGVVTGDMSSVVSGVVGMVTQIIDIINESKEMEKEAALKKIEEEQAHRDMLKALNHNMQLLKNSTYDLTVAMRTAVGEILGLGSSSDSVALLVSGKWQEMANSLGVEAEKLRGAFSDVYGNASLASDIFKMSAVEMAEVIKGLAPVAERNLVKDPRTGRHIYETNPNIPLIAGGAYQLPETLAAINKESLIELLRSSDLFPTLENKEEMVALIEKQDEFAKTLIETLQVEVLKGFRENLYQPLNAIASDGAVTNQELINSWETINSNLYEAIQGLDFEVLGEKLSSVLSQDFLESSKRLFEYRKEGALEIGNVDDLKSALEDYKNDLIYALNSFSNLSATERDEIARQIRDFPEFMEDTLQQFVKDLEETFSGLINKIADATSKIADAFSKGYLSFSEAMGGLDDLEIALLQLPEEIRSKYKQAIDEARYDLLQEQQRKRDTAMQEFGDVGSGIEDFIDDLDKIDEKFNEIKENWGELLKDRDAVIADFNKESQQLLSDSEARIQALEDERDAAIGTFDFSETQNQRSNRFTKVRELEQKILEEISATSEKLSELDEKRKEKLADIDKQLEELKIKYGELDSLETARQEERNAREKEFIEFLREESIELSKLLGQNVQMAEGYENVALKIGDVRKAAELALEAITKTSQGIVDTVFPDNLEAMGELGESIKGYVRQKIEDLLGSVALAPETRTVGTVSGNVSSPVFGNQNRPSPKDALPDAMYDFNTGTSTPIYPNPMLNPGIYPKNTFFAADGFNGIVKKLTHFVAGEKGPEHVSINPVNDLHSMRSQAIGTSITNIYMYENLDLRGAYGITTPAMAEDVYRKVWEPARRRNLGRFLNTKGKVIR